MKTRSPVPLHLSQVFSVLIGFALFSTTLWVISREFRKYPPHEVLDRLKEIPIHHLLLAIALVGVNYVVLSGYDLLAMRYIRHSLPMPKTVLAGFISYAVSNSIGFALLSGSAVRYHFYSRWGLSPLQIAQIITFCNLSFWIGLFAVGGVLFLVEPPELPSFLHLPFKSVCPIGAIFLILVIGYFFWNLLGRERSLRLGPWQLPHLSWQLALAQILVTSLDWTLAASVLYFLLSHTASLSYLSFLGIYLLSQFSGIISNVPGGLGVFETVMLLLLSPPIRSTELLGVLLAYRVIYYGLPLVVALTIWGSDEVWQRVNK